ncbi:MAG: DNA integrity scanning diadenylate cyclase DisA [Micropruina glycogenica]|uniref:DNA integrity scanning protein DisA n=1 Tax=Micropruina glycogenica TaxID=75385 RepID=A0A2N9JM95_9ACTN|nr:DNA integrity scanning diadenylate cyclase DisA [Micropruina glycogenica]SPD88702.1 DNA integrity scanning protein DisA [Micropruina glycogenica]
MNATSSRLNRALPLIAPGTELRDGLDRIVQGRTGALVTLGNNARLQALATGGFAIDVAFTGTALRELAKMDGAIILNDALDRILFAGVHLMPDASVETSETGTRHRTADRVASQTGVPTVTVSASMSTISLFVDGRRWVVQRPEQLLARANQALATLARYATRLNEATARLSAAEVHDAAAVRDIALVAQRLEMVRRLQQEVNGYAIELGTDGRLVRLQLRELVMGLDQLGTQLERDYADGAAPLRLAPLAALDSDDLAHPALIARACGLGDDLGLRVSARGHRQLAQIAQLSPEVAETLVVHFGDLQALFGASTSDLLGVDGVDYAIARAVREGLIRLAESAYAERLD